MHFELVLGVRVHADGYRRVRQDILGQRDSRLHIWEDDVSLGRLAGRRWRVPEHFGAREVLYADSGVRTTSVVETPRPQRARIRAEPERVHSPRRRRK